MVYARSQLLSIILLLSHLCAKHIVSTDIRNEFPHKSKTSVLAVNLASSALIKLAFYSVLLELKITKL